MNCEQLQECLTEYVDGEVQNPVERAEIEAHLAVCASCRKALARAQKFTTTVSLAMKPIKPREGFATRVLAMAKSKRSGKLPFPAEGERKYPLWPLAAIALLAAAIGVAILLGGRTPSVGTVVPGAGRVKVFLYDGGEFRETPGTVEIPAGAQVEAVEEGPPVRIALANGRLVMRGPMRASLYIRNGALVVSFANAGRVFFRTPGNARHPLEIEAGRVSVRVDAEAAGEKAVDVEVAPDGTVTCSVMRGAVAMTGPGASRNLTVAEGFQLSWPQTGPAGTPAAAPPDAFKWFAGNE
jgi:ferric-dicitrate binding protein FerR (iron transport regulator)